MDPIHFVAICSPANSPVFFYSPRQEDTVEYQHLIYCALDVSLEACLFLLRLSSIVTLLSEEGRSSSNRKRIFPGRNLYD